MLRIAIEVILVLIAARWGLSALRSKVIGGRRQAELERGARWETHTEAGGGQTSVLVRRVGDGGVELGRQVVAAIPDTAPDWDLRYHEAMAEARSRLAALDSQSR